MAKKSALGRGLGALINDVEDMQAKPDSGLTNHLKIDKIETNPFQPRTQFDEEALKELAQSISEIGIVQPITVRKIGSDKYQLIAGERRFRASQIAGLKQIPAYIRSAEDDKMLEMALVENIQREDLDSIEVAISYQRLIDECKLTQENLSERIGKKRSTISNYLRLLKLPAEIQKGIRDKKLLMGHARALVNIDDPETQIMIYQQIIKHDFSVRKVEDIVRELNDGSNATKKNNGRNSLAKDYVALREHLAKHFDAEVDLKRNSKGTGKIIIPFKSDEDLERILGVMDQMT